MELLLRRIVPVISAGAAMVVAWAFPFGPPNGFTVAPGDKPGVACTQCHQGTALNGAGGSVKVLFPNGLTYTPGESQTLRVVINDGAAATFGFQMSARLESGPATQQAGSFIAGDHQKIVCSDNAVQPPGGCGGNGIQWIEHSQPFLSGGIPVQWTPPAVDSGNIHIYVSANAANGDNTPRGDHIYAADYVLTPASTSTANIPTITSIANGASGAGNVQAGSWITITGTNFAASAVTWDNAIVNNVLPTTLGGVTVAIDGRPAPISSVSQTQIQAVAPLTSAAGNVNVVVSNANGSSAPATVTLVAAAPGLFTLPNQSRYVAGLVLDSGSNYEVLAPPGLFGSSVRSRAAKAGDTILLYGSGFGPTTVPLNPEVAANVAYPLAHTGSDIKAPLAQVTIGGIAAQVLFCGIVSPGVYQINAVVPSGLSSGDQPVQVTLLSGPSVPQMLFIPVQ